MEYNVAIIGGGIYGAGLLHDLATRGIQGVHLFEKGTLASETSSKSTKLMHGGLRYLEHIEQWGLVYHALNERNLFLSMLPEIVKPVPLVIPSYTSKKPKWMIPLGLFLYDLFSASTLLPSSHMVNTANVKKVFPLLKDDLLNTYFEKAFCYYDGQMVDDVIVRLATHAACKEGATFDEHATIKSICHNKEDKYYLLKVEKEGRLSEVKAKVVILAGGVWNNTLLLENGFIPKTSILINGGSHILFDRALMEQQNIKNLMVDEELSSTGLVLPYENRIVFLIPWLNHWLCGTTEHPLSTIPSQRQEAPKEDVDYLFKVLNHYFNLKDVEKYKIKTFMGMRAIPHKAPRYKSFQKEWTANPFSSPFYLSSEPKKAASLARETVQDEVEDNLFVMYGGKYTTYRLESEMLGNTIAQRLEVGNPSRTALRNSWHLDSLKEEKPEIFSNGLLNVKGS
jgi:glycerol-3-phosphate dehydrogenase